VVARETGFVDPRRMREAFMRTFGLPPQAFRRQAREKMTYAKKEPRV
jgi:transcriptional regulator GlxA family with amidase domain